MPPTPNVISGQAIGSVITVNNSADLAAMSCQGITVGTKVWNAGVDDYFTLSISSAALVPDDVVAALGFDGYRWIKDVGEAVLWQNTANQYVASTGNDSNDGLGWNSPKRTIYAGLRALIDAAGGTLYVGQGCSVGGPVPGQGIRLRTDNLPLQGYVFYASVLNDGWLPLVSPIRIIGSGASDGAGGPFTNPGYAEIVGGGGRENPTIWIAGTTVMPPLTIEGLTQDNCQVGVRVGVDYDRDITGLPVAIPVTTAARVGTDTTLTLTLPTGFAATLCERTNGLTKLTIPNPGIPFPPWRAPYLDSTGGATVVNNVPIRFTAVSGINSFTGHLSDVGNAWGDNATWTVTYFDAGHSGGGDNIAPGTPCVGTVSTHGLCPGEFLDLASSNVNWMSTMYLVTATDANGTDVTVTDAVNVTGDHTASNIGTIQHQERTLCGTTNVRLDVAINLNPDDAAAGPSYDIGNTIAWRPEVMGGLMVGCTGRPEIPANNRDEYRMASCLLYAGTSRYSPLLADAYIHDIENGSGNIYLVTSLNTGVGAIDVRRVISEPGDAVIPHPVVRVDAGGGAVSVNTEDIINADQTSTDPWVILNGVQPTAAQCIRSGPIQGACVGGDTYYDPGVWTSQTAGVGWPNPWQQMQVQAWADGRVTGKHPVGVRGLGVLGARFKSILPLPDTWTPGAHTTISPGVTAPDGTATAFNVSTTGTEFTATPAFTGVDGNTWVVGGKFYLCGWVNLHNSNMRDPNALFRVDLQGGCGWVGASVAFPYILNMPCPFSGTGWQFVSWSGTVATLSTPNPAITIRMYGEASSSIDVWGMQAAYVPDPSVLPANDASEFIGTLRHQPYYLAAGMSGTMEGGKLIAHGGLGIDTSVPKVAGAGSGQLTVGAITTYEPRYAADGVTVIGWAPLYAATVNP